MLKNLFVSESVKNIFNILKKAGSESRFVGGCVRDAILNIPIQDLDIATTCLPDEVETLLSKHKIKTINIGKDFGTVIAVVGTYSYEITTLRKDVEFYDGRHAVVEYSKDWREDAERRDLTFNAMSYCPYKDTLYDYFSGKEDLSKGLIRFIGKADDRVKEDFLRILRFFRFYSYYGQSFDPQSLQACVDNSRHLSRISAERKWQELYKILLSKRCVDTLEFMVNAKVLDHVLNVSVSKDVITKLRLIRANANKFNHADSPMFILFIITYLCDIQTSDLKKMLSLPNKEARYISSLHDCVNTLQGKDIKGNLYLYAYKWKSLLLDALIFLNAQNDLDILYKEAENIIQNNIMRFPLSGYDIIQNFSTQENDKKIGVLLEIGKEYWCREHFVVDKKQIIDYIKNHEK